MRREHEARALLERTAYSRKRCAYTRIVRDLAIFHRHVEIDTDEDPLLAQVEIGHFDDVHGACEESCLSEARRVRRRRTARDAVRYQRTLRCSNATSRSSM